MSTRRVHQVLVGAARNDAITSMALEIRDIISDTFESDIYCYHPVPDGFPSFVKQISDIDIESSDDIFIYHLSFGIPEITKFLLGRKEKIVLAYHNVTPFSYYSDLLPEFAEALKYGKHEPTLLLDKVNLAIAYSKFNANELEQFGYENVHVVPGGANPQRLDEVGIDVNLLVDLENHFPNGYLLFVSQVLPHKRVDHALEIVHILRTVHRLDVGLVVAGPIRQPVYEFAIDTLRSRLHNTHVLMTDAVTDEQLATLYRGCICYIGTSEHEGLSVPPLEAMANRAPVVVLGAGAVPETVKDGGIVLPASTGVLEFAEVVAEVIQNESLQSAMRISGAAHVRNDFVDNTAERFAELVMSITV